MKRQINDLKIGPQVRVTFDGGFYRAGSSSSGPWNHFELRFTDQHGGELRDTTWNRDSMEIIDKIAFNIKLSQLINVLAGEDAWNNAIWNPLERQSFVRAFRNIVKNLNRFRGHELYIKTIIKEYKDDKYVSMLPLPELLMLDNNQIFSKEEGVLKYNDLEFNNLEDYGYNVEKELRLVAKVSDIRSGKIANVGNIEDPNAGMKKARQVQEFNDLPF